MSLVARPARYATPFLRVLETLSKKEKTIIKIDNLVEVTTNLERSIIEGLHGKRT